MDATAGGVYGGTQMIKITNIDVSGFPAAVRSMRNPMNSWEKSDSYFKEGIVIGEKDLELMKSLFRGGTEHRKFMRTIQVTFDCECNHIWWAQFDTYRVGVTRNSCSKMHRIHVKPFDIDDFSHEGIDEVGGVVKHYLKDTVDRLEMLRGIYNETGERKYWRAMLELLPMGYNIKATVTMNYEVAANILRQRKGHKIAEWNVFCVFLITLPYLKEIMGEE